MGIKTIGLREDVYERLKARKREDESFTDLVDRLIDETTSDWRETFGTLSEAEAAELERVAARARQSAGHGLDDRQRRAIDAFAGVEDPEDTSADVS
ncbi:antitoxin VapB family protein [Salinigranum salinum]|uniref:antitoxin VapB family protein n=1 Tax=Salinigranum salinum TaxID=1364937 RepID=UPI00126055C7|nr:antitoxin VapB family protein [Salinigranum salinum]